MITMRAKKELIKGVWINEKLIHMDDESEVILVEYEDGELDDPDW